MARSRATVYGLLDGMRRRRVLGAVVVRSHGCRAAAFVPANRTKRCEQEI